MGVKRERRTRSPPPTTGSHSVHFPVSRNGSSSGAGGERAGLPCGDCGRFKALSVVRTFQINLPLWRTLCLTGEACHCARPRYTFWYWWDALTSRSPRAQPIPPAPRISFSPPPPFPYPSFLLAPPPPPSQLSLPPSRLRWAWVIAVKKNGRTWRGGSFLLTHRFLLLFLPDPFSFYLSLLIKYKWISESCARGFCGGKHVVLPLFCVNRLRAARNQVEFYWFERILEGVLQPSEGFLLS